MGAWVDPVPLAPGLNVNHCGMSVEESTVHWLYRDGTNLQYRRSYDEGNTFTDAVTIATGVDEIPLDRPVCSQNETVLVFYCKQVNNGGLPPQIFLRRSTDYGNTWSAEITIDDGTGVGNNRFVRLASAIEGANAYITWVTTQSGLNDQISIRRSTDGGATWATEENPFPSAVSPGRPDIGTYGNWVHLAWTDSRDGTSGGGGETYYSRSENYGVTWGTEVNLSNTASHDTLRPSVSVTGSCVFIAWQYPVGTEDIYYRISYNNGLTFIATTLLYANTLSQDHVFTAAKGSYLAACWTNWNTTPKSTYFAVSKDLGATWSTPEQSYAPPSDTAAPRMDFGMRYALIVEAPVAADAPVLARSPVLIAEPSQQSLLDDFNRADDSTPPPGVNWTNSIITFGAGDGVAIVSNQACRRSAGAFRQGSWYNATKLAQDQDVVVEISAWVNTSGNGYGAYARLTTGSVRARTAGYGINIDDDGAGSISWSILRLDAAATPSLRSALLANSPAAGDLHAVTVRRDLIVFWIKRSGGSWQQIGAAVDLTYTGPGWAGLEFLNNQEVKITNLWGTSITEGIVLPWTTA